MDKSPRFAKGFEGEEKVIPYVKQSNRRLTKAWGFSTGETAYIYFDQEYWPITIEKGVAYFFALKTTRPTMMQTVTQSLLIGAVGSAVLMAASRYKSVYAIDMATGRIELIVLPEK